MTEIYNTRKDLEIKETENKITEESNDFNKETELHKNKIVEESDDFNITMNDTVEIMLDKINSQVVHEILSILKVTKETAKRMEQKSVEYFNEIYLANVKFEKQVLALLRQNSHEAAQGEFIDTDVSYHLPTLHKQFSRKRGRPNGGSHKKLKTKMDDLDHKVISHKTPEKNERF